MDRQDKPAKKETGPGRDGQTERDRQAERWRDLWESCPCPGTSPATPPGSWCRAPSWLPAVAPTCAAVPCCCCCCPTRAATPGSPSPPGSVAHPPAAGTWASGGWPPLSCWSCRAWRTRGGRRCGGPGGRRWGRWRC